MPGPPRLTEPGRQSDAWQDQRRERIIVERDEAINAGPRQAVTHELDAGPHIGAVDIGHQGMAHQETKAGTVTGQLGRQGAEKADHAARVLIDPARRFLALGGIAEQDPVPAGRVALRETANADQFGEAVEIIAGDRADRAGHRVSSSALPRARGGRLGRKPSRPG